MTASWSERIRLWCSWGRQRVRPRRLGDQFTRLEDRVTPVFTGGVAVAAGDWNGDGYQDIVTGAGPGGGPHVRVFSGETGDEVVSFYAYDVGFTGGVAVAVGDVTGDGRVDLITGAGAGGGPHVRVFDGVTRLPVFEVMAYDVGFTGGVTVAAADLDGDGRAEVITGAGPGGGPHVRAFSVVSGAVVREFMAYDEGFRGGVWVAGGDVTGDKVPDIVTGAGAGGGPHVKAFDGSSGQEVLGVYAYDSAFTGGARVAVGDLDGDGVGEILTGARAGGGPHVRAFRISGEQYPGPMGSFYAYAQEFGGGVFLATADLDGDGRADVITGAGAGGGPHVRAFRLDDMADLASFFAYAPDDRSGGFARRGNIPTPPVPPNPNNTAPTVSDIGDRTIRVGESTGTIPFTVGDQETPPAALSVSVTSSNPALLPVDRIALGGVGADRTLVATPIPGASGVVVVTVTVTDAGGATASDTFVLTVQGDPPGNTPPTVSLFADLELLAGTTSAPIPFAIDDAETDAGRLEVSVSSDDQTLLPAAGLVLGGTGRNRTLTLTPAAAEVGEARVVVTVRDEFGAVASSTLRLTVTASPVLPTFTSTAAFAASTAFLYTGSNPVQTGVADGTIVPVRAAVLRGKVVGLNGQPLAGVTVTVLGHGEFGRTTTRADGTYDLAVNGGGLLTVAFDKSGYLAIQRQADVDWQDYTVFPQVALTPLDESVTTIDLASAEPFQVARGGVEADADGQRQATLLFPRGVQATMTLPNGTVQPLTSLAVRATEYTVGGMGPMAMPGTLPATSGYTYAVELSVDQAMQAGATRVDFTQAVPFYVENFLIFPVGMAVPAGYYDRGRGLWVPDENGRVVQVLAVVGGVASLDTDGDGDADTAPELASLGITTAEQARLATLYTAGQSLWRVPVTHFTPWDCNWPYGPPDDAVPPNENPDTPDDAPEDENCLPGSIIGIQRQTLGEAIGLTGTPFSLVYQSDRVPGRTADRTMMIPLTKETLPSSLKRVELTIRIGGRSFEAAFTPSANLKTQFEWDGLDAYGRRPSGAQKVEIDIGYVYQGVYRSPSANRLAFGQLTGSAITGNWTRQEITLHQQLTRSLSLSDATLNPFDARMLGLGGWSIDAHHVYDPVARTLHYGNGRRRTVDAGLNNAVETVAGTGVPGYSGDGGSARAAQVSAGSMAVGPDGSLYIAGGDRRVRRVGPDGRITTVAGNGQSGSGGDGGFAIDAQFSDIEDVELDAAGNLYIADYGARRVRKVTPAGIISTLAGNGTDGGSGDGGPATAAPLYRVVDIATAADGSLYIGVYRDGPGVGGPIGYIRRVDPSRVITTVAGGGGQEIADGALASAVDLELIDSLTAAPDGSLYFSEGGFSPNTIWRIWPDGRVRRVAGGGAGLTGDSGPATDARLDSVFAITLDAAGQLYLGDGYSVRKVGTDGILTAFVGTGVGGYNGDGRSPLQSTLQLLPFGMSVGPDGALYLAQAGRVRRVAPVLPGYSAADTVLPSEDGGQIFVFDAAGRHLRTLDTLTRTPIHTFGYDPAGRLVTITDAYGNITTVERDTNGNPTAVIGPYGQRTRLAVGVDGYLARVTNPANGTHTLRYAAGGLLTEFTDPRGNRATMVYDELGRLVEDRDPENGFTKLARTELGAGGYKVTTTNAEGGTRQHLVEYQRDGSEKWTSVDGRGFATVTLKRPDGSEVVTAPDGTVTTTEYAPDPRFGMLAPVMKLQTVATPSGLTAVTRTSRTATFTVPGDSTSPLQTLSEVVSLNADDGEVPDALAGHVFADTDEDGVWDDGEQGIAGVLVVLNGTVNGSSVSPRSVTTDASGFYQFTNLTAGVYRLTEVQPGAYLDGVESVGTLGGTAGNDVITGIALRAGEGGVGYNFGEIPVPPPPFPGVPPSPPPPNNPNAASGTRVSSGYDAATRTLTTTTAEGRTSSTTLNDKGRVASVQVPGVLPTQYAYDARGRLSTVTQGDRTVTYDYTAQGYLASISDPLDRVTTLTYDAVGRITKQTQPDGTAITFRYDAEGNMVGLTLPGKPEHTFTYDRNDQLTETDPPFAFSGDDTTDYTYNLARQVVRETLPGGVQIDYAYCECGRLTGIDTPWGDYTYTYSTTTGELSRLDSPGGFAVTYGYDGILQTSEMLTGPVAGRVDWTYDANFRVVSESVNGANPVTFAYDGDGLLTRAGSLTLARDAGSGRLTGSTLGVVTDAFGYNAYGEQSSYRADINSAAALQTAFTHDKLGRITRKVETVGGVTITTDYGYDPKGQLVAVTENGVRVQTYEYDANGNRLGLTTPAGVTRGTYDAQDRLLTYGTKSYSYSPDGSLKAMTDSATGERTGYIYDWFGNLTRVDLPDGRVIEYLIDGQSRRVGKKVDGVLVQGWLYDGQLTPVAELDGSGTVVARFVYAGGVNVPAYMIKGGVTYRFVTDHLGSVRLVINVLTGEVAQQVDYDVYGRCVQDTNPAFQPFGYAGGLIDKNTNLVRFGFRDYIPDVARWVMKDHIGFSSGSINIYTYVDNDPVNYVDPLGLVPCLATERKISKAYNESQLASNPNVLFPTLQESWDMTVGPFWRAFANHAPWGALDTKMSNRGEQYSTPLGPMTSAEFGNFTAGIAGANLGSIGDSGIRRMGEVLDFFDHSFGAQNGPFDWDADSKPMLDAGKEFANAPFCGCGGN